MLNKCNEVLDSEKTGLSRFVENIDETTAALDEDIDAVKNIVDDVSNQVMKQADEYTSSHVEKIVPTGKLCTVQSVHDKHVGEFLLLFRQAIADFTLHSLHLMLFCFKNCECCNSGSLLMHVAVTSCITQTQMMQYQAIKIVLFDLVYSFQFQKVIGEPVCWF